MKGDILVIEQHHIDAGIKIVSHILNDIPQTGRYILTISGESGSGKSETAKAVSDVLERHAIRSVILGQDDYFKLPPISNDRKRRSDSAWLGPNAEVEMDLLNEHIRKARSGENDLVKPLVDYANDSISLEEISLDGVRVIILEGTYTALLRHVDCRVFIARNRQDTLEHRKKRNRGTEAGDPFIEDVLRTEHKIIAGFQYFADIIITREYEVVFPDDIRQ